MSSDNNVLPERDEHARFHSIALAHYAHSANSLPIQLRTTMDDSYGRYIQEPLFTFDDTPQLRGYRGSIATKISGITYRQLDYWDKKGIIEPSIIKSHGSGTRRLYSFKDIVLLSTAKRLLDIGLSHSNVIKAIGHLQDIITSHLTQITLVCNSQGVYECYTPEQIVHYISSGEAAITIEVSSMYTYVENALLKEKYIDITKQCENVNNPLDRLKTRRLQQRLLRHPMIKEA